MFVSMTAHHSISLAQSKQSYHASSRFSCCIGIRPPRCGPNSNMAVPEVASASTPRSADKWRYHSRMTPRYLLADGPTRSRAMQCIDGTWCLRDQLAHVLGLRHRAYAATVTYRKLGRNPSELAPALSYILQESYDVLDLDGLVRLCSDVAA